MYMVQGLDTPPSLDRYRYGGDMMRQKLIQRRKARTEVHMQLAVILRQEYEIHKKFYILR